MTGRASKSSPGVGGGHFGFKALLIHIDQLKQLKYMHADLQNGLLKI
jgi:hypothetical protein